jgi:hypothetical protein
MGRQLIGMGEKILLTSQYRDETEMRLLYYDAIYC